MLKPEFEAKLSKSAHDYLDRAFKHHPPNDPRIIEMHEQVRATLRDSAALVTFLPNVNERRLALEALELAVMWANAAIAREHKVILENLDKAGEDAKG